MVTSSKERTPLLESQEVPGLEDTSGPSKPIKLERTVGVLSASAIVFGNCVGAGIFISPRGVYEKAGSAGSGLIIWGLCGLVATLCTLAYAELGTMMQESGGEFVYIKNTYGKFPAFLFSFCNAFLIKPAALTVTVITFSDYLAALIWGEGVTQIMVKSITASAIVLLTVLNIVSAKLVIKFCSIISALKLLMVGFLLACGVVIIVKGKGHFENFSPATAFENTSTNPSDYGLSFLFCSFSFQSWNSLNFMTEELKSPTTTLPRGGFLGMAAVTLAYILANISYLMMFSVSGIIDSKTIAMDSGHLAFGKVGELIMCIGLLLSCLGSVSGGMMCISRNIQSTAEVGLFPKWMAGISPTFNTPVPSIITLGTMQLAYLFVDTTTLIPCLASVEWFFYCVTFSCLIYLRYTEPKNYRPFKVPVPVSVLLFIVTATCVLLPLFSSDRYTVILGFATLPLGSTLYIAMKCYIKHRSSCSALVVSDHSSTEGSLFSTSYGSGDSVPITLKEKVRKGKEEGLNVKQSQN